MTQDQFVLADDLPKENPWREDRLGFSPFAERLSRVVTSLKVPNGYVIGLHGEWGSGKSTALNFVKAFLEKHNQEAQAENERITVIDFRPWIVSGHQDLIAAFFKVMSESLAGRTRWWRRQFDRALRFARITTDPLVDAVATVAVTVDPSAGIASKTVATVSKKSLGQLIDRFLNVPSLQSAYRDLQTALQKSSKRFLVIIDDLDRLQVDEICSIMQMVKTVGRLPNVVYLLAYDRRIVWNALDGDQENTGPRFAEKIVQQEIELPAPSKESLLSILDSEIVFLSDTDSESLRWHYIVRDGVRRWVRLRHPRDVLRLANAVKFSWPALTGEIDPQDLLAIEGLRLFDAEAFNWVRWNRDFLFTEGRFMMSQEETRQAAVDNLKGQLPTESVDAVMSVLSVLFPSKAKHFGDRSISGEPHGQIVARRGIGCEAGYDAFFGLRPSPDAIPKQRIDEIITNLHDEEYLVRTFNEFIGDKDKRGQPKISPLVEELRFRFQGSGHAPATQEMLDAIFRVGESVIQLEWKAELFSLSPRAQIEFLAEELLRLWGEEAAAAHLLIAFQKSTSPAFSADIFVTRAQELRLIPTDSPSSPLITKSDLDELGKILLPQIKGAAKDGSLANAPFYWDIARSWKYLGGAGEPKAWLCVGMQQSAEFLAKVTRGLVGYSISSRERTYSMRERPDEELYDLHVLLASCRKHLEGSELNDDERNRVEAVASGVERLLDKSMSDEATDSAEKKNESNDKRRQVSRGRGRKKP